MNFYDFQVESYKMPKYDDPAIGLAGEVGEVLEHIKKDRRTNDRRKIMNKDLLLEEVGDVLHYLAQVCNEYDVDLDEAATLNVIKLKKRHKV